MPQDRFVASCLKREAETRSCVFVAGCKITDSPEAGTADGGGRVTTGPTSGTDGPGGTATSRTDRTPATPTRAGTTATAGGRRTVTTDGNAAAAGKTARGYPDGPLCASRVGRHVIVENRLIPGELDAVKV